jgi:hypothetical protein
MATGTSDFANVTEVTLRTNHDVAVDFDWSGNVGRNDGEVELTSTGTSVTLTGVPQAGPLDGSGAIIGGGGGVYLQSNQTITTSQPKLRVFDGARGTTDAFSSGEHKIGLGVSLSWSDVLDDAGTGATFAPPATYTASIDATIVPNP